MSASSDAVREFHTFFGLPTRTSPTRIVGDELEFRKTLITEEYEELIEALDEGDMEHILKEAADLLYVVYGLQWHVGMDFDQGLRVVHHSNMTKLWTCETCRGVGTTYRADEQEAGDLWEMPRCQDCGGSGRRPRYREDGKVLKPPTYQTPDLSHLV